MRQPRSKGSLLPVQEREPGNEVESETGACEPQALLAKMSPRQTGFEKKPTVLQSRFKLRFKCSFSFIITLVSEESWTGCCLSSSQTCPMLLVQACFRALKIELRSETSKTLNFRNYSLNPTFCPKREVSVNVGLGEGQVGSFLETYNDPKYFSFSKISLLGQIGEEIRHCYALMTPYKSF